MNATLPSSMVFAGVINAETSQELDFVELGGQLAHLVKESGIDEGIVNLFVAGSTAALTTIEFEPGAVADLKAAIARLAGDELDYDHNARWGDGNGRSHVRAALVGPCLTVPVREGRPLLGTWQQVVLIEMDTRGRSRRIHVTIVGERSRQEVRS